jgi:hypothetical protein
VFDPSALPAPPPAPPPPEPRFEQPQLRPGHLTAGWRNIIGIGWVGVLIGWAAVWKSSWTLGFSTWWLGPQSDSRFPLILVLPFILPIIVVVAALRHLRYLPYIGFVAAAGAALIAWGDVGRQNRFAIVEFALAGGGLLVSVASLAGMVRLDRSSTASDASTITPGVTPSVTPSGSVREK